MYKFASIFVLATALNAFGVVMPGTAADGWVLARSTGDVRVHRHGGWTLVSTSPDLQPGDTIWTGPGSRALLQHPSGLLSVSPDSMVRVPDHDFGSKRTIVYQRAGQIAAEVNKRPGQSFTIRTQYLATVVKGTSFSITIGTDATVVAVGEGVVMVQDMDTGQATTVRQGRAVATRHVPNAGLSPQFAPGDATPEQLRAALETPQGGASGTVQALSGAVSGGLGGTVSGAGNAVGGAVTSVGSTAGNAGGSVGGAVGNASSAAGNASSAAGNAGSAVGGAIGGLL